MLVQNLLHQITLIKFTIFINYNAKGAQEKKYTTIRIILILRIVLLGIVYEFKCTMMLRLISVFNWRLRC